MRSRILQSRFFRSPLLSIVMTDLLRWRRSPLAVAGAMIPPAAMALLLAVLSLAVGVQPVALVVEGNGPYAQEMEQIIRQDQGEVYLLTITDGATATQLLDRQQVAAVITIPQNFDELVPSHEARVVMHLNNVDLDVAEDLRRSIDRSVATFNGPGYIPPHNPAVEDESGELQTMLKPFNIQLRQHDLRETNVPFLAYQILPVLILLILSVGLIGTSLLCAQDWESGSAKHLLLAPIHESVLIAGRLVGGVVACVLVLIPLMLLLAVTHIIAPPADHWPAVILLLFATAVAASGLGALLGSMLHQTRVVAMASSVVATYLFFLGGGFTTIAFLPDWLQTISALVPTRYAIDGLRSALFYAETPGLEIQIGVLFGTALASIGVGSLALRQSWRGVALERRRRQRAADAIRPQPVSIHSR